MKAKKMNPQQAYEDQPTAPFNVKKWLVGNVIRTLIAVGIVAALALFFLADGFIDIGKDPAIPNQEIKQAVQHVDDRVAVLEKRIETISSAPAAENNNDAFQATLTDLEKKVEALEQLPQAQTQIGLITLALTQIKTAYESDDTMLPGLMLLKKSISNAKAKVILDELITLASNELPTKASIIAQAEKALGLGIQPYDVAQSGSNQAGILGKVKNLLGGFVTVQPTATVTQQGAGQKLVQALSNDDLPLANNLISQLPSTPSLQTLAFNIQTRLRAQNLVRQLVTAVTEIVGDSREGLY
jgi:hypothetical protein